jgi:hypothetical protein
MEDKIGANVMILEIYFAKKIKKELFLPKIQQFIQKNKS